MTKRVIDKLEVLVKDMDGADFFYKGYYCYYNPLRSRHDREGWTTHIHQRYFKQLQLLIEWIDYGCKR